MMLLDLADACRKSGLRVVELPGWRDNARPASSGGFDPRGVLCHHTGAKDTNPLGIDDDRRYAEWLAEVGRSDLPAPLCQIALDRTSTVYVCAAGRGNHGGEARATGPMPAGDANELYVGIEAHNSGDEGWDGAGTDADGNPLTQREGYARLVAALCAHYEWPAPHARAHRETSVTGKWDPGLLDMDDFRAEVARLIDNPQEDEMTPEQAQQLREIHRMVKRGVNRQMKANGALRRIQADLERLEQGAADDATKRQVRDVWRLVKDVRADLETDEPATADQ